MLSSPTTGAALKLLALGPNPAFQRVLTFDAPLQLGGVNRAAAVGSYVGGKGQGVALALQRWSPGSSAVAHFLGGDAGAFVESEVAAAGIEQIVSRTAAVTRTCTTLLTRGAADGGTELIDPSGAVSEKELASLLRSITGGLGGYAGIALCGTAPPGGASLYGELCRALSEGAAAAAATGPTLVLDGFKQVEEVLGSGRLDVLKLNVDEALALTGAKGADEAAQRLLHADDAPLRRPGSVLALTDGPRVARLYHREASYRLVVPTLERVVNAIGAGDVCTAVFLHELCMAKAAAGGACGGREAAEAFAMGLAAASVRCGHETPAFERAEVEAMRERVVIQEA